jgi:Methane oxygenase PmoA
MMSRYGFLILGALVIGLGQAFSRAAEPMHSLTISAGDHARSHSLVEFSLPATARADVAWELVDERGSASPTQSLLGQPRRLVWPLSETLPAGQSRTYSLRAVPTSPPSDRVEAPRGPGLRETEEGLSLVNAAEKILTYHTANSLPPAEIPAHYARSGHIHPLQTPSGKTMTAEFPADHAHQHGVFFAWVQTQFAGHEVDFWNQGKRIGNVRHRRLVESRSGPVYAGFESVLDHLDLSTGVKVVLNETWRVMAIQIEDAYLVDIESTQTAATEVPLKIQKYHYGGFGWRGPSEWLLPTDKGEATGCEFLTSEGHGRVPGNHTRPRWVSVTGRVNGDLCTLAIFGHPANLHHPQPVRLHPDKPYFCFAPCVLSDFEIKQDQPLTSRYRIITHDGPARPERYQRLVQDWESPIKVQASAVKP